jgi:hypothetical protein
MASCSSLVGFIKGAAVSATMLYFLVAVPSLIDNPPSRRLHNAEQESWGGKSWGGKVILGSMPLSTLLCRWLGRPAAVCPTAMESLTSSERRGEELANASAVRLPPDNRIRLPSGRTGIFCFVVIPPPTLDGLRLLALQLEELSKCPKWAVYSNASFRLPIRSKTPMRSVVAIKGSMTATYRKEKGHRLADNTPIFRQVWAFIARTKPYRSCDWVVKVDPDTVFLPARARRLLAGLQNGTADVPLLFSTPCKRFLEDGCVHGAMMLMTSLVVDLYWTRRAWHTPGDESGCGRFADSFAGEDAYFKWCAKHMGSLLTPKHGLLPPTQTSNCGSRFVAYHPHKKTQSFRTCLGTAVSQEGFDPSCAAVVHQPYHQNAGGSICCVCDDAESDR